jgi:hypothetical protein
MITAEKLSIAVKARLAELNETPESLVEAERAFLNSPLARQANKPDLERNLADALLLRAAVDQRLPKVDYGTVRACERALGYSEFTLFAFSADGRGLPEFGETYS